MRSFPLNVWRYFFGVSDGSFVWWKRWVNEGEPDLQVVLADDGEILIIKTIHFGKFETYDIPLSPPTFTVIGKITPKR